MAAAALTGGDGSGRDTGIRGDVQEHGFEAVGPREDRPDPPRYGISRRTGTVARAADVGRVPCGVSAGPPSPRRITTGQQGEVER
ncbi:hypothetical protein M2160_001173 [Streptomyces sp. SAI-117]|uniref:hypothetical protein n=1 Tax=unclassified Streptomyces TaxID=2593676 RepID=UPI002472EC8E|nr:MULTISPECIES: hypothetical protein [unclassified Streptomyces]MDH6566152.1 hypothetical protein [Streptomyces sp. SAI-117]MDH6588941.1 hypothetical protein [Streptomyces sp. SAI-133]